MTTLTIDDLFTPATSDEWEATLLANADTLQLKTTSWEEGSPTLTIIEIVSSLMSQEDGLISIMAQGGFLDFAATGQVTYTAANGIPVTQAVTPDPSDPTQNPTGAPGWLDLLASSVYNVQRLQATYATGPVAVGNPNASTLTYAAGTYHVENPTTGATYANTAAMSVPQGTAVGGGITGVSNAVPIEVQTTSAHGLVSGATVLITDVTGTIAANGMFVVTVISPTLFSLNSTDGSASPVYAGGGTVRTTTLVQFAADIAGTSGTSNVGAITLPVTTNPGVLVLNPSTLFGTGFESNTALVTRCRARLAALSPNGPKGAYLYFALSASDILGNPDNPLFVAPAVSIPAITRATLGADKTSGTVTLVVAGATGAVSGITNLPISNVANTTPIQITTGIPHTLSTGDSVTISGVIGTTEANGTWTITVVDATHFNLNGSVGVHAYSGGGAIEGGILGQVDRVVQANAVPDTDTAFTVSAVNFPVAIVANVSVPAKYVATYTVAVQTALALYNAGVPFGGINGVYSLDNVIGVLFAAGIIGTQPSYVQTISGVTLNGTAGDLAFPGGFAVATLSPAPVINVVGV